MTRPLRIEFDGALYHLTARGDRRDSIYRSDGDRLAWLSFLAETCDRFNFLVYAYCQMTNHYHVVLETVDGELARGMRYLNGNYSQYFNRRHKLVGHVFQGRYKAILCQHEVYLKELARYVVLNPVRAKIVPSPAGWAWSSHRATLGMEDAPRWLAASNIIANFGSDRQSAIQAYDQFVLDGIGEPSPLRLVTGQLMLGDDAFCRRAVGTPVSGDPIEIARGQRRAIARPLGEYFKTFRDPQEAMARAYLSLGYSMPEIARHCRVSVKTVSRAVASFQAARIEIDQK